MSPVPRALLRPHVRVRPFAPRRLRRRARHGWGSAGRESHCRPRLGGRSRRAARPDPARTSPAEQPRATPAGCARGIDPERFGFHEPDSIKWGGHPTYARVPTMTTNPETPSALRFGLLGAARIAPDALIDPADRASTSMSSPLQHATPNARRRLPTRTASARCPTRTWRCSNATISTPSTSRCLPRCGSSGRRTHSSEDCMSLRRSRSP